MPTQLDIREREQTELLTLVDDILRLDWDAAGPDRRGEEHQGMLVSYLVEGDRLDEVIVSLPDDERVYLAVLGELLGRGTEIATCRRRVHRWLTGGREVLLDACCDSGCRLIVD
ncbi:MAG: hypothetical protein M0Z51_01710 [Propionibacterium sp.]|nr:hypothetical protein [Propionibacterium sp.]